MSAVPVGARCQQTLGWREVAVKLARSAVLRNPTFVPSAVANYEATTAQRLNVSCLRPRTGAADPQLTFGDRYKRPGSGR